MAVQYLTIHQNTEFELVIKKSRFICSLARVHSEQEAQDFITRISKENRKANHNCYAYLLGDNDQIQRESDNGEPSGTAGVPILSLIHIWLRSCPDAFLTRLTPPPFLAPVGYHPKNPAPSFRFHPGQSIRLKHRGQRDLPKRATSACIASICFVASLSSIFYLNSKGGRGTVSDCHRLIVNALRFAEFLTS